MSLIDGDLVERGRPGRTGSRCVLCLKGSRRRDERGLVRGTDDVELCVVDSESYAVNSLGNSYDGAGVWRSGAPNEPGRKVLVDDGIGMFGNDRVHPVETRGDGGAARRHGDHKWDQGAQDGFGCGVDSLVFAKNVAQIVGGNGDQPRPWRSNEMSRRCSSRQFQRRRNPCWLAWRRARRSGDDVFGGEGVELSLATGMLSWRAWTLGAEGGGGGYREGSKRVGISTCIQRRRGGPKETPVQARWRRRGVRSVAVPEAASLRGNMLTM